jgi:hypothetical protein
MRAEPTLAETLATHLPTDYSRRRFFRLLATGRAHESARRSDGLERPRRQEIPYRHPGNSWTRSTRSTTTTSTR